MLKENENQLFSNQLLNEQKFKKPSLNKIPKCIILPKNIPIPSIISNKNINKKTLLPSKQSSTNSIKAKHSNNKKSYLGQTIPYIQDKNIYSSIQNYRQIIQNKNPKLNLKKRIHSSEKSKSEKNDESTYTSRKNINIDLVYNYQIEYNLLKENIQKILVNKLEENDIDITNQIMGKINLKLKNILEKTNEYIDKNEEKLEIKEENIKKKEEFNKKILNLYIEKFNIINNRLKEINNDIYMKNLDHQLEEIKNEIEFYEKENKELLSNNISFKTNCIFKNLTLPNIKILNNNGSKNEQDLSLDKQLQKKLFELKNQISQEISISKKICENEINLKKYEEIINDLESKYNKMLNNYEKGIFIEEENVNNYKNNNIHKDSILKNKEENNTKIFNDLPIIKEKNKKKFKNELVLIEKKRISKINKKNELESLIDKSSRNTKSLSKESKNRIITTTENNYKNEENNILCLPFPPTKKKNLSCANITSNIDVSKNKKIKELIIKNLDLKEKEEKTLINIHENNTCSSNKFKHIKLKPNFSFNNDYHLFKDEKIKKIPKMQSSVENKNTIIVNLYNNNDKEELINESIQIDESSIKNSENKNNDKKNNIIINNNNDNYYNEQKTIRLNNIPHELLVKNNEINLKKNKVHKNKNNKLEEEKEEKKNNYSITTEQREKVLNTIMYDDIVEQGSIL